MRARRDPSGPRSPSRRFAARPWRRLALAACLAAAAAAAGFAALAWHGAIDPVATPARADFDPGLVRRGATLAAAGFCTTCHTAEGGRPFAGGHPLATPFGTIWGTNITPDRDTGIGTWSRAAFDRAMREGVDREGRNLYPAFPYNHFTQMTDGDLAALYAYFMTREPVHAEAPAPALRFPYNLRPLLAGWNLLFLRTGPAATADADPVRARGRYLAEAVSHCGACHTPRNALGAERSDRAYAGGEAEGWWSPPLDRSSPAPLPWTEESLFNYLRSWDSVHGGAVGPMQSVTAGLATLPAEDVRALAHYVAGLMGPGDPARQARTMQIATAPEPAPSDPAVARGATVYRGACAGCHESGGAVPYTVRSLAQHTTLNAPDPRNVARVVLHGVHPGEGEVGAIMPGFAGALSEAQVADLLVYLRTRFTDRPAWTGVEDTVRAVSAEAPGG